MKNHYFLKMLFAAFSALMLLSCSEEMKEAGKILSATLTPDRLTLQEGETAKLSVELNPKTSNAEYTFLSSDTNIATVSNDGVVSAIKAGNASIILHINGNSQIEEKCEVTVVAIEKVEQIVLNPMDTTVAPGNSFTIKATILPETITDIEPIQWSSSDSNVAEVDNNGNVNVKAEGSASITASIGNISSTCNITAIEKKVHPLSLYAEYHVSNTPGVFATSHNKEDCGFYNWESAQTACPAGWHLPNENELSITSDCWDRNAEIVQHCLFNGKSNFSNIPEKALINGEVREFTADYFSDTKNVCYAIKFKDEKGDYLSAYRWTDLSNENPFEVRARFINDPTLTVEDIANDDFWNKNNEDDIVRKFPGVGYKYANGNSSGENMLSYCWSSKDEAPSSSGSAKGLLLYFLKGNYVYTGAFAASFQCSVRCIKDSE